jgi:hypothetical protein
MIAPMTSYHIAVEPTTPRKRVRDAFLFAALWLIFFAVAERVAKGQWTDPVSLAIGGGIIFLGICFGRFLFPRHTSCCDVEVDDDGIRLLLDGKAVRRVQGHRVRYVAEWGSGRFRRLVISEHGATFTRLLWGGIGVPARLPQYEQIKAQALRWLENSKA